LYLHSSNDLNNQVLYQINNAIFVIRPGQEANDDKKYYYFL